MTTAAEGFARRYGNRVLRGPMEGLTYPTDLLANVDYPVARLAGSYEQELHAAIETALRPAPRTFVDIGYADGYYAVGLARRCPDLRVEGFELSRDAERTCKALADANGVGARIRHHGAANQARVGRLGAIDGLVLADVEGFERELFSASVVGQMREATVIIELHEIASPGVTGDLRRRFEPTHEIEIVPAQDRDTAAFPEVVDLPDAGRLVGEWERTDGRDWLVATPRA